MKIYDLYLIGGPRGFYVGQAVRQDAGGWERRIAEHRGGKRNAAMSAHGLLSQGASARCLGSISGVRNYVNLLEAHAWDRMKALGWIPMHQRPRDDGEWGTATLPRTPEWRAKVSASLKGHDVPPSVRARIGAANKGRPCTPETRAKLSAALRGRPGYKKTKETRQKLRAAALQQPRVITPELRKKLGSGRHPQTLETRAKISATKRAQHLRHSPETRAKISKAACARATKAAIEALLKDYDY